jgi:hypothetical protein
MSVIGVTHVIALVGYIGLVCVLVKFGQCLRRDVKR